MEEDGHTSYATGKIQTAATILIHKSPDLLLLDLMIGGQNSIQIADLAAYKIPNAEVIYVTGSNKFPHGELFELSRNTSWVLRKPVDFFELKFMIAHIENSISVKLSATTSSSRPSEVMI